MCDILDPLVALIRKVQLELVADLVADGRRTGDAAGRGEPLQPHRQVHAVAVEVVAVDDDVAEVDAHAKLEMPVLRHACVALGHAALDLDGTARGVEHAAELDQEPVAHHLEDAPAVPGDDRIEELAAMLAQAAQRLLFVGLHEAAVADNVGSQDRREPPFNKLLRHAALRSPRIKAT